MMLNPYGRDAVLFAVDLVNRPPASARDLEARCVRAGVVIDRPVGARDLEEVRGYLAQWVEIADTHEPAGRASLLNALLSASAAYPRLTDHAASGWHIHYRDDDIPVAAVLRSLVSVGTALHLTGRGMHRLSRCAVAGCERVFADVSPTGRQRYCGTGCANRDAVRRHRASTRANAHDGGSGRWPGRSARREEAGVLGG